MNVIKIVLKAGDELPKSCSRCNLYLGVDAFNSCMVERKSPQEPYETRASWCPLVVEEVCEWKLTHDNDPNITYKSNHYIDLAIPTHVKKYVNHCPCCGRRIKYVESEE